MNKERKEKATPTSENGGSEYSEKQQLSDWEKELRKSHHSKKGGARKGGSPVGDCYNREGGGGVRVVTEREEREEPRVSDVLEVPKTRLAIEGRSRKIRRD